MRSIVVSAAALVLKVLKLRRRVRKLSALLRLALALLRTSGFRLTGERLPDGRTKTRILRAVDRAREHPPIEIDPAVPPSVAKSVRCLAPAGKAWVRSTIGPPGLAHRRLDCHPSRSGRSRTWLPHPIIVTPDRHARRVAQRLGKVWASPSTWYRLVQQKGWRWPGCACIPW